MRTGSLNMAGIFWRVRGSEPIAAGTASEDVMARVEIMLDQNNKPYCFTDVLDRDRIAFDDPLWRLKGNWYAMAAFDRGEFWIEEADGKRKLCYELRTLHAFVFCLCVCSTFFMIGVAQGSLQMVTFAVIGFFWVYGVNRILGAIRTHFAINRAIDG